MKTLLLLPCLAAVGLTGCSAIRQTPSKLDTTSLGTATTFTYDKLHKGNDNHYLKAYAAAGDADKAKLVRNQIIDELMGLIDDEFENYCRHVRSDKAMKNSFVKVVSIALTGAAPFSIEGVAKALAGIDTGLKGVGEVIDVEAWGSQAPEILINVMRTERAKLATAIIARETESEAVYTLQRAITDLIAYRNAGYAMNALISLAQQSAKKAVEAEDEAAGAKADPQGAQNRAKARAK